MILDHLISNYLDGDLTPEEDVELRRQLAADPGARETFDAAVLLHIAMRCEDDVPVPDFDRERTRLAVHERIAGDAARRASAAPTATSLRRVAGPSIRRAASLVASIMLLWVPVKDILRPVPTLMPVAEILSPASASDRSLGTSRDRQSGSGSIDQAMALPAAADGGQSSHAEGAFAPTEESSDAVAANDITLRMRLLTTSDMTSNAPAAESRERTSAVVAPTSTTSIMLSTYYAQGAAADGRASGSVTQIAQSIGYGVSDRAHIGIEVGQMRYDVAMTYASTSGPAASSAAAMVVDQQPTPDDGLGKLPSVVNPGSSLTPTTLQGVEQTSQIWGAAFYQHEILRTDIVAVRGRLGAGAAQDGLLSYMRVQAETRLTGGIALSLGTEARLAPFRTGAVSGMSTSSTYGAVFSLLYGVRIDL